MQTIIEEVLLSPEGGEVVCVWDSFCGTVSKEPDMQVTDSTELAVGVSWGWKGAGDDVVFARCR